MINLFTLEKASFHRAHLKGSKSKLVHEAHNQLRVLEHMVEANMLHGIVRGVDVGAGVVHVGLHDERAWEPVAGGRGVVRAGIAA